MNALDYDKSRHYSISTIKIIQRVVGATVDGKWGPQTVEHVEVWQQHHGLNPDGMVGPHTLKLILAAADPRDGGDHDHDGNDDGGHSNHVPPNVSDTIRHVGVWATSSSLGHNADADVKFCLAHNIDRLDVFINSVPNDANFHTHDLGEIHDLCKRATDAGMAVHLTSWIRPYTSFIEQAAKQLIPLCKEVGARSLIWDAEEPWNRGKGLSFDDAAQAVSHAFSSLPCPMNVSGIINTPAAKFGPLARVCEVMVPQCYATYKNQLDPRTLATHAVERWRQEFAGDKKFEVGLAAYDQLSIDGMSTREGMVAALEDAAKVGADTVIYWSLPAIKRSQTIAQVISEIRGPTR